MPKRVVIPKHTEVHCEPCIYHKVVSCSLGDDCVPFKEYGCTHPGSLVVERKAAGFSVWELEERVKDSKIGHRYIGRVELCPEWCPLDENLNPPPLERGDGKVEYSTTP